ncbi:uncharacterized protein CLUP02_05035 [Colletotrichum lupini]|uniref:Uncharacterized protein n=1 Tax=Colletotrichum lupini TaxID=145971 RepID=A0A9Q8SMC5_9PEZI|nr:uncharacterized protein CLUP02_05035 [Colletotrichum lupini]UQC79555.1 hypothetical protein CLUP02_05035 [Colletotrichum lupini]
MQNSLNTKKPPGARQTEPLRDDICRFSDSQCGILRTRMIPIQPLARGRSHKARETVPNPAKCAKSLRQERSIRGFCVGRIRVFVTMDARQCDNPRVDTSTGAPIAYRDNMSTPMRFLWPRSDGYLPSPRLLATAYAQKSLKAFTNTVSLRGFAVRRVVARLKLPALRILVPLALPFGFALRVTRVRYEICD